MNFEAKRPARAASAGQRHPRHRVDGQHPRRTAVYTTLAQVNNGDTGRLLMPRGSTLTPGQDSSGFEAGVYHSF